jgi:hypothetical protein
MTCYASKFTILRSLIVLEMSVALEENRTILPTVRGINLNKQSPTERRYFMFEAGYYREEALANLPAGGGMAYDDSIADDTLKFELAPINARTDWDTSYASSNLECVTFLCVCCAPPNDPCE